MQSQTNSLENDCLHRARAWQVRTAPSPHPTQVFCFLAEIPFHSLQQQLGVMKTQAGIAQVEKERFARGTYRGFFMQGVPAPSCPPATPQPGANLPAPHPHALLQPPLPARARRKWPFLAHDVPSSELEKDFSPPGTKHLPAKLLTLPRHRVLISSCSSKLQKGSDSQKCQLPAEAMVPWA